MVKCQTFFFCFAMRRGAKPPSKERKQNEAFLGGQFLRIREETFFLLVPIPSLQSPFSSNLKVPVSIDKTVHWDWENSSQREKSEGRML